MKLLFATFLFGLLCHICAARVVQEINIVGESSLEELNIIPVSSVEVDGRADTKTKVNNSSTDLSDVAVDTHRRPGGGGGGGGIWGGGGRGSATSLIKLSITNIMIFAILSYFVF